MRIITVNLFEDHYLDRFEILNPITPY